MDDFTEDDLHGALRGTEWTSILFSVGVILRNEGASVKQASLRLELVLLQFVFKNLKFPMFKLKDTTCVRTT